MNWLEIEEVSTYKIDLLTYDEIVIDIKCKDIKFTIDEDSKFWNEMVSNLCLFFPMIDNKWYGNVAQPPFASNYTIIYQNHFNKLYADFLNTDESGCVRLNTNGSLSDIKLVGDKFKENIWVLLSDDQELNVYGRTQYSAEENIWVAKINWNGFMNF